MRRSLRPNQFLRMIENRFVTSESSFVDMTKWDACVDPTLTPVFADKNLIVDIGVDASVKHDSTAIVAVAPLSDKRVRLVTHRIFQPTPDQPLDFEATVEATLIDLCNRFAVRAIRFDPYQMQAVAQRLQKRGLPVREFPQTVPNLTLASQGLWELIEARGLLLYPDAAMRLSASHAVAIESPRGWASPRKNNRTRSTSSSRWAWPPMPPSVYEAPQAQFGVYGRSAPTFGQPPRVGTPDSAKYTSSPEDFRNMLADMEEIERQRGRGWFFSRRSSSPNFRI